MILSRFITIFAVLASSWAGIARADDVDLEKAVASLIDAERDYNKLASEKGFRAASMQNFTEDAVIFAPKPKNGKRYWEKETDDPLLFWQPSFASIARSGDLGYTTGPWEYRKTRDDEKPQAFGHFVTVWKKQTSGVWKVALDVGTEHPQPKESSNETETFVPDFPIARPDGVQQKLEETEKSFAESLAKDAGAAVLAKAGDEIRIYRRGAIPGEGKTAAQLMLSSDHGKETRTRAGGGVSKSNDLAYSYGDYVSERANTTERGIYFSVWQLDLSSEWRLVLDLQKKAPEKR